MRSNRLSPPVLAALAAGLVTSFGLMLPHTLCAQQAPTSVATPVRIALQHATLAADATELPQVRQHLQHVLNCLEGKGGSEYSASAGDPCKGSGALDATAPGSANRLRVTKAIRLLTVGVTFQDFKPAHYVAQAVQAVLAEIGG